MLHGMVPQSICSVELSCRPVELKLNGTILQAVPAYLYIYKKNIFVKNQNGSGI